MTKIASVIFGILEEKNQIYYIYIISTIYDKSIVSVYQKENMYSRRDTC